MTKYQCGVVHGRFQPLHLDHMKYILAGLERCHFLYIGITNPDPSYTNEHPTDINRSQDFANPLTYWERLLTIKTSLIEVGVDHSKFDIVPFPINKPELVKHYAPLDAGYFITVYDDWGKHKRETLLSLGLQVETLWEREISQKGITATQVRERVVKNENWEELVPPAVARIIKENRIDARIKMLYHAY